MPMHAFFNNVYLNLNCLWIWMFQAIAAPREILLNKVPFPLPNPEIFNRDQILAQATDTVVSENCKFNNFSDEAHSSFFPVFFFSSSFSCLWLVSFLIFLNFVVDFVALTFSDLGLVPHKLKGYPVEFLIQYRKGGPNYGSTVSERVSPDAWPWVS